MHPIQKHLKYLGRVYHPVIDGGSLDALKQWIKEGHTYIGIGNDSTDYLNEIFNLTQDKVKVHGFAMTKNKLLENYPFYSADSTSAISTVIYGSYFREGMKIKKKSHIIEERSIEFFHNDHERLENALQIIKKTENYLTQLWKKKNVTWKD